MPFGPSPTYPDLPEGEAPYGIDPNSGRAYKKPMEDQWLTGKQKAFVDHYLRSFNVVAAARYAGYSPDMIKTAHVKIMKNPKIAHEIAKRKEAQLMLVDELRLRLASQARAEYAEYYLEDGTVDLERLLAEGHGHLIKTIKRTRDGFLEITWQDAQTALTTLAKIEGLFTETVNNTGKVTIQVNYGKKPLRPDEGEDFTEE